MTQQAAGRKQRAENEVSAINYQLAESESQESGVRKGSPPRAPRPAPPSPTQNAKRKTQNSAARRAWLVRLGGTALFVGMVGLLAWQGTLRLDEILRVLAHADPWLVGLAVIIYFPFVGIKSERWRLLAADLGVPMSAGEAWRLYAIGLAAGAFTPGQAGDLVKAWTLHRRGHRLGAAIASSVLDRLFDLAGLAVLAALGVWIFGQAVIGGQGAIALLGAGAVGTVLLVARRDLLRRLLQRRTGTDQSAAALTQTAKLKTQNYVLGAGWTVLSFVVSTGRVWLLGVAIGLALDPATVGGLVGLTTVAALVPVSVSGVGTRDATMVALLATLGQSRELALAFSALILVLNIANAGFGYVVWWLDRDEAPGLDQSQ